MAASQTDSRTPESPIERIQGYDAWPFNHGKHTFNIAILDTGVNSTYVINRDLLDNITNPATAQHVIVADGSAHTIEASGTLLGYPSIHVDNVPSFIKNLIGASPIIENGAVGTIQHDKMVILDRDPYVDKLVDFVINYSSQNNLVVLMGSKSQGLFVTPISSPRQALLSIHSHHFNPSHDMVYYFYLVFNCPHSEAYCKIVSSNQLTGLPKELTTSVIRKYFPRHDPIRSKAQQSKMPIPNHPLKTYQLTYCGKQVEIDILMISTPTSSIPKADGFKHVVLVVDAFSSFLFYVPIKSIKNSHRFIASIINNYQNAGFP